MSKPISADVHHAVPAEPALPDGAPLGDLRRRQILDAAAGVFARRGFHGASMAEIARSFGMSAGHIYNHFDGKEQIIEAIVERDLDEARRNIARLRAEPDVQQAIVERIASAVDEWFDQQEKAALNLEVIAEASRNPRVAAMVQRADSTLRAELRDLFEAAERQRPAADRALQQPAPCSARVELMMALFEGLPGRGVRHPGLEREALSGVLRQVVLQLVAPTLA